MKIFIFSAFARYLPGGIWNIVGKAAWCIKAGADAKVTAGAIIMEYLFQIASALLFLLFFLPELFDCNIYAGYAVLAAAAAGVAGLPLWIKIGTAILAKIFRMDAAFRYSGKFLYILLLRYCLAWLVTGVSVWLLALALGGVDNSGSRGLFFAYPPAWVAGFLSPSPNGLGVREYALKLLVQNDMPEVTLALTLLTLRLSTIAGEVMAVIGFKLWDAGRQLKRVKR